MQNPTRPTVRTLRLELPFHLIQAIRAAHALMECDGVTVQIPSEHAAKFTLLRERFGARFTVGDDAPTPRGLVRLDHERPTVAVGELVRPLLFPQAVFDECRRLWRTPREIGFLFAGTLTPARTDALRGWWERSHPPRPAREWQRLRRGGQLGTRSALGRLAARLGWAPRGEELLVSSSERGRHFPVKTWDREYFERMASARFVLCPNGDFVWTYRFFEAAMCGAIPVIEDACPEYAGFECFRMSDDPRALEWDPEVAEANFARCRELLTIPAPRLAEELARWIPASGAPARGPPDGRGAR